MQVYRTWNRIPTDKKPGKPSPLLFNPSTDLHSSPFHSGSLPMRQWYRKYLIVWIRVGLGVCQRSYQMEIV